MHNLLSMTKLLEDTALHLTDIKNQFPKLMDLIMEIVRNQEEILKELKNTLDNKLNEEYKKWVDEKQNYLCWLIDIGVLYEKYSVSFDGETEQNLKNLIEILTKYNAIRTKISNEDMIEKIKKQINDLFKSIFPNKKSLIDSEEKEEINLEDYRIPSFEPVIEEQPIDIVEKTLEPEIITLNETPVIEEKEKLPNIKALFNEDDPLNHETLLEKIKSYCEFTKKSMDEVETEFFGEKKKEEVPFSLKDDINISFDTNFYDSPMCDVMLGGALYPTNIKRQIKGFGIKIDDNIKKVVLKSEVERLLKKGSLFSALLYINGEIEGWVKITDIKK